jgi:hypothetical protein
VFDFIEYFQLRSQSDDARRSGDATSTVSGNQKFQTQGWHGSALEMQKNNRQNHLVAT